MHFDHRCTDDNTNLEHPILPHRKNCITVCVCPVCVCVSPCLPISNYVCRGIVPRLDIVSPSVDIVDSIELRPPFSVDISNYSYDTYRVVSRYIELRVPSPSIYRIACTYSRRYGVPRFDIVELCLRLDIVSPVSIYRVPRLDKSCPSHGSCPS